MSACTDIDALMIDWLYGELDESQEAPFDDHLAGCARCRAELESLKETRDAMRELPQVEPPQAVSAILLHEAAKRAPAPARARAAIAAEAERGPGILDWLASLFRPVLQHPAATAVATLVLVAGVAGSLYLRGAHEVAEPLAITDEEISGRELGNETEGAAAAGPAAADPAEHLARGKLLDGRLDESRQYEVRLADEGDSDVLAQSETLAGNGLDDGLARRGEIGFGLANDESVAVELQKKSDRAPARVRERKTKTPGLGGGGSKASAPVDFTANAVSGADPLVDLEEESFAQPPPGYSSDKPVFRQSANGQVAGGTVDRELGAAAERPTEAKPTPTKKGAKAARSEPNTISVTAKDAPSTVSRDKSPARVAPKAPAPPPEPAGGQPYRVYRDPKKELEWAKTESRKLSKALGNQRCRDAAKIANDILDRNPEYYYDKVSGTKSIKRCQWYVDNEYERRARDRTKARAQKRRPSPKQTTGQAAHPADEAAVEAAE